MGRLLFNVLGMVAEFEADLLRMRTREGMAVAKAKGRLRGKKGTEVCQLGGCAPAHGRPLPTPACPGQSRQIEYDRVLFFSDAVFAIAITLLIVDLRVPDVPDLQSGQQLRDTLPQIGGFALSFAVIGLFWTGHHRLFRHVKGPELVADAAQLAVPGLHRVPALSDRPAQRGRRPGAGDDLLRRRHRRRRAGRGRGVAVRDPHPRAGPARHLARGAPLGAAANPSGPGVFLLSIPVAITGPDLARYLWLLVFFSGLALRGLEPADEESAESQLRAKQAAAGR
jgi:Endosomal/lysosomal potassium channel TMEM175/Resolvase, N terminal domain